MIELRNINFTYSGAAAGTGLKEINLTIRDGETVILAGESGCGKTSITRLLNGLIPHYYEGNLEGEILIDGRNVENLELYETTRYSGSVFQNPRTQFFAVDTDSEMSFECENYGMPEEEIRERVEKTTQEFQVGALRHRDIFLLSGGEKQKLACASISVDGPEIMILDEPSSNLDMTATHDLQKSIRLWKDQGKTIVIAEHRLAYLMDLADRIIYIRDGRIAAEYTPEELIGFPEERMQELGLRPVTMDQLPKKPKVQEFRRTGSDARSDSANAGKDDDVNPPIRLSEFYWSYDGVNRVLDIDDAVIPSQQAVAVIGYNGTGKSTFARCLIGLQKKFRGKVEIDGESLKRRKRLQKCFMVMQDAGHQLFTESVLDEVLISMKDPDEKEAENILESMDLLPFRDRHPMSLSGGQMQRLAVATAVASERGTLIFDEPTSGLDLRHMLEVSSTIDKLRNQGRNIFIISHDLEFLLRSCTWVVRIENGRIKEQYPLDAKGIDRLCCFFLIRSRGRVRSAVPDEADSGVLGRILQYAGQYRKYIYLAVMTLIAAVICQVIPYYAMYRFFLEPVLAGSLPGASLVAAGLSVIALGLLGNAVFYNIGLSLSHKSAYHTLENIRNYIKDRLIAMPMGDIENLGTGAIRKLFTDDVENMEIPLAHAIPEGLANILVPVSIYILMFIRDARLGFLSLVSLPIGGLFMFIMYKAGLGRMDSFYKAARRMNNTILEYVNGMEVIKVFNRDSDSYRNYAKDVDSYRDYTLDWYRESWPWMAAYGAVLPCVALVTLPVGAYLVFRGYSALPDLVLVLCLSISIGTPLMRAMAFFDMLPQINYKIGQIEKVLHFEPLRTGTEEIGEDTSITYDHVSFSYEDKEVIHDVSLRIPQGTVTAFVGESGSGKSTLAKLLVHFYDPEEGSIRIGQTQLTDLDLSSLNNNIAFVSQEQFLFNTSIYENIRMGRPDASEEAIKEAARRAECLEFIERLPDGIMTRVGDAGKLLSGGERQRVSIARAVLKDAPIVVLDEATSSVDSENADRIDRAVREVTKGKTVVVIGHRLKNLTGCDQIAVLEEGNLIAAGRHEELLGTCASYRRLWEASESAGSWTIKQHAASVPLTV